MNWFICCCFVSVKLFYNVHFNFSVHFVQIHLTSITDMYPYRHNKLLFLGLNTWPRGRYFLTCNTYPNSQLKATCISESIVKKEKLLNNL